MQVFYSTDIHQSAEQVLEGYSGRWSLEEAFQGRKSHLGFGEPQGWSRQAVRRTAPLAMPLYGLTVPWFAQHRHVLCKPPCRPWYRHKVRPSFADMLATLRYACLRTTVSATPADTQDRQTLLALLPDTLRALAVCRQSRSLSEAGRVLFAQSRTRKQSTNDSDELKRYLTRFGLNWDDVSRHATA